MAWEFWIVIASFGQLIVISASAVFAYMQIRGLRRQQEANLIQEIFATLNSADFAAALDFVYNELEKRLIEPGYVAEIAGGRATAATHLNLAAINARYRSRSGREAVVVADRTYHAPGPWSYCVTAPA
jgi:hypothetical protein